jgi:peptidoglycan/xylan/chitin deacetylase (PgdA/CDA1 family)
MKNQQIRKIKNNIMLWTALVLAVILIAVESSAVLASSAPRAFRSGESGVALMFNVYQNTENVEEIKEILGNYGVSASFFLGGIWAEKNRELIFDLYLEGHDIGNHGFRHLLPTKVGPAATREEIQRTDSLIRDILGEKPLLYAPPSGDHDQRTVEIAQEEGYLTILWSADTIDWRDQDAALLLRRTQSKLTDGGFLLMHPTPATVKALPQIIEWILLQGYEIKPVSQILLGD